MTIIRASFLSIFMYFLSGCANFESEYIQPQSSDTAQIIVTSTPPGINERVIIHGDSTCKAEDAKFVGLLHAKASGQEYLDKVKFNVKSGNIINISMPQFSFIEYDSVKKINTFKLCQPIASFNAEKKTTYYLNFSPCNVDIYAKKNNSNKKVEIKNKIFESHSCKILKKNTGTQKRLFYLEPK